MARHVFDEVRSDAAPFSQFAALSSEAFRALRENDDAARSVVVLTEHDLVVAPGQALLAAQQLQREGHRIALADVGNSYPSLAILPLLRPDIIAVDLKTLHSQPDWQSAQTLNAVTAYAEELPAIVLTANIDSERDRDIALSLGSTLGQGEWFTRSSSARSSDTLTGITFDTAVLTPDEASTPFTIAAAAHPVKPASRKQLAQTSHFLETCAFDCDEATVILSTFQASNNLTPKVVELYSALARNLSYVFAFTHPPRDGRLAAADIPHLRVRSFDPNHPLSLEWNVIILNARYQAMLAAREIPRTTDHDEPHYEYVLTHNRETILRAAYALTPLL